MANKRFIDFPIATTVGDNDIILIWQGGANKQTTKATILSGVPDSLNDLTDVTISGLTNGQILRYDSVTGQWENTDQGNLDLNDLNDVTIVSPTNGQVLVYNSSTSKWENSSGGYVPYVGAVTTVNLGAQTIQAGSFVKQSGTASQFLKADGSVDSTAYGTGSVTSVGLTMPAAFNVANSPITTAGTLAVTGAGTVAQYIRGDGSLADFPESSGGGSSVSYYLNGSVDQGTIGGIAYKELSKVPILGAGTDFTINADGYIASFITDAGDPSLLEIPGGNWNFETYFSASSSGGTPTFYVELYKVSGTTAILIASSSSAPELIAFGTNLTPYFSSLAVPTTTLALTDRLAVRYYVTHSGRTITLHTENNHLCQIITTFTTGLTALNGLTAQVQNFAVGTTGTDFNIASATATHTFNLPTASATNRGALSSADWSLFTQAYNDKINSAAVTGTTTKTLTLTQQDGGTITASWSDLNTDAVLSVFGRTGAVVAANGDYTTAQVTESGNLYYTDARVNANANVAANTAARHNAVTLGTANGLSLSTQVLSLGLASAGVTGALSGTDWSTFNNKANSDGSNASGTWGINITGNAATASAVAWSNISGQRTLTRDDAGLQGNAGARSGFFETVSPVNYYSGATSWQHLIESRHTNDSNNYAMQIAGSFFDQEFYVRKTNNSATTAWSRLWHSGNITPVTSVTASSPLASSGGTTPNITIQQASGSQSGFLSSTDWTTFNNKQNALTNPVTGTGTTNYLPKFTGSTTIGNSSITDTGSLVTFTTLLRQEGQYIQISNSTNPSLYINNNVVQWQNYVKSNYNLAFSDAVRDVLTLGYNGSPSFFQGCNLLVGTTSDNGARLQVSGGNVTVTNSGNVLTTIRSTSNTGVAIIYTQNDINNSCELGTWGSARAGFGAIQPNNGYIYAVSDLAIGSPTNLKFSTGASNSTRLTIDSLGAATFSSSVTAANNITCGTGAFDTGGFFLPYSSSSASSRNWKIANDQQVFGDFSIKQSSTQTGLPDTTRFYIKNDGNVGIGTPSPSYKLDVQNASDFDIRLRDTSLGGTVGILFETGNDFSGTSQAFIKGIGAGNSGVSQLIFGTAGSSGDTSATERMRITSSGNVGIGTDSPMYVLDAYSTGSSTARLRVQGTTNFALTQAQNSSGVLYMGIDSSTANGFGLENYSRIIWSSAAYPLIFAVNDAERMRITSSGNVGIGTNNPTSRLTIAPPQVTNASSLEFSGTDNAAISAYYSLTIAVNNSNTQSGRVINFSKGGKGYGDQASTMMSIIADTGNVLIGAVSDVNAKLFVNGDIRTGALDGGYVAGYWKLGRAVIGTQPSETYQIIVEINGQLYSIGAANI